MGLKLACGHTDSSQWEKDGRAQEQFTSQRSLTNKAGLKPQMGEIYVDVGIAIAEEGVWEREDVNYPEKVTLEQGWRKI